MARPTRDTVQSGTQGWDGTVNNNFVKLFDQPIPIHVHTGDETDLDSSFPPAGYENCLVWVDHTTLGSVIYRSDGAIWEVWKGGVASGMAGNTPIAIAASDEASILGAGTAKTTFRMPGDFRLEKVRASLTTASSSGIVTVDINVNGTSILSTKLTIDQSEKTSETAATAAVLTSNPVIIDSDDEITIDLDTAGTGAIGLKVYMEGALGAGNLGEPDYEITEVDTGVAWTDNKPIYKKTVAIGALPNASTKSVAHGITGLSTFIELKGQIASGSTQRPLPFAGATDLADVTIDGTNINVITTTNLTAYSGNVTLYYTKV